MNWYKTCASALFDFVSHNDKPNFSVSEEVLPDGYYFMQENGKWSVIAPNGEVVSTNEPTKKGARQRAMQLINFIKAKSGQKTVSA